MVAHLVVTIQVKLTLGDSLDDDREISEWVFEDAEGVLVPTVCPIFAILLVIVYNLGCLWLLYMHEWTGGTLEFAGCTESAWKFTFIRRFRQNDMVIW